MFTPCFICGTGRARHRLCLISAGHRWVCAFCDPQPVAPLAERMADALVLAAAEQPIGLAHYARACEILSQARFAGSAIVDHAEAAIRQAVARLAGGERAGLGRAPALAGARHGG